MKISTFYEVIGAAHLTYKLGGVPDEFDQRGGIFLVGPPGQMKSAIIGGCFREYPNALVLSDLNVRTLNTMRDSLVTGKLRSLGFPDFEKLYERQQSTSTNLEGNLKALVSQGFLLPSIVDQRINGARNAKAFVAGGMIPSVHEQHFTRWIAEGFTRRFLWCHFQLRDPEKILAAISAWKPIKIDMMLPRIPLDPIPFDVSKREDKIVYDLLQSHEGGVDSAQFILMKKIISILKWKNADSKTPAQKEKYLRGLLEDFAESLTKDGAFVDL